MEAGLTAAKLRRGVWQRVGPALYAKGSRADLVEIRLAAVQIRLPVLAAFSERTAAWLHGLDLAPCAPIQVVAAPEAKISARSGAKVRRALLHPAELGWVRGFRVTSPLRTVLDLGSRFPLIESVSAVDMALHKGLVEETALASAVTAATGRKGSVQLRRVLALCDGSAESPMETRLRVLIELAGLPRPQSQLELFDAEGEFIARVDLCYPDHRLVIEFDGGAHREQLVADNRRQNRIIAEGYRVLRFTGADVLGHPDHVIRQVAAALGIHHIRRRSSRWEATNRRIGRRMDDEWAS